jgi:hypothetical protein
MLVWFGLDPLKITPFLSSWLSWYTVELCCLSAEVISVLRQQCSQQRGQIPASAI